MQKRIIDETITTIMKKKTLILMASVALLCACQSASKTTTVRGTLTGVGSDTLLLISYPVTYPLTLAGTIRQDTLPMQQGKFTASLDADTIPMAVTLMPKPAGNRAFNMRERIDLLLFPNDKLTLNGSFNDYRVEGSPFYTAYAEAVKGWADLEGKLDSISAVSIKLQQAGTPADSLRPVLETAQKTYLQIREAKVNYIRGHLDSDVALYLLSQVDLAVAQELLSQMAETVKNGPLAALYHAIDNAVRKENAHAEAKKAVSEGAAAPDFTLKDLQGNALSLSSLRGKYVVLDFWGSWCGWCIKGIPEMKKYYDKYKSDMEILGIDCRDTEEQWKEAVKEHDLPWLHVRNAGDPDISELYAIEGYPTKIVIDPEGKIAKVVVGEDPAFYKYLDELFK